MLENKTIKKRLEVIKQKSNIDFNVDVVTDAIETVVTKDVTNTKDFLIIAFNTKDENNYKSEKEKYIIKKKREYSQENIDARFNKAYKKLLEKYGKGE